MGRQKAGQIGYRWRLLLLVLVAIGPLAAFQIVEFYLLRDRRLSDAHERVVEYARQGAAQYGRAIADVRGVLELLSHLPQVTSGPTATCNAVLGELVGSRPWVTSFAVVGPDGQVLCGSDSKGVGLYVTDRSWFKDAVATGEFVSDLHAGSVKDTPIAAAALAGRDVTTGQRRVIAATFDPRWFDKLGQDLGDRAGSTLMLFDSKGVLLWQYPTAPYPIGSDLSSRAFVKRMLATADGSIEDDGPDGRLGIYGFAPLAGTKMHLVVSLERGAVLARVNWATVAAVLYFAGVCAFVATLIWLGGRFFAGLIQEKTKLLEATLDNMNQGLIVVDSKGSVPICNRRAIKLLDLPEDLMNSHPHFDQVMAFQKQQGEFVGIPEEIQRRLQPRVHGETENVYERRRPNGTVLEIRTVPFVDGGVVRTYSDISYRRKIEEKLEAREKLYRLVTDNATDIIGRLDLSGNILYVSPASRTVLGYAPEEMIGTQVTTYIHPGDVKSTTRAFKNLVGGNSSARSKIEYRARRKDGTWLWLEANPTLIRDEAGVPLGFVDVVRDITARRAAEAEAAQARLQTEQAMAAQGQFLASMSHELRTPLNSILGFANLILERQDIDPGIRRQIVLIRTASSSLLTVVNDVLDFSQLDEGKLGLVPVTFSLAGLIDDSVAIVREFATKKRLDLRVIYDPTAPLHVIGDDTRLRQVLLNLLNNAVKFTRAGQVALRVEHLGSSERGASLRFSVADTGIGIPEAKLDRLFKRFSQVDGSTSREFGGSGLGLAISKRLIELMGGEIGVKSVAGEGSTFWFTVELAVGAGDAFARRGMAEAQPPAFAGSARILLAEDVEVNQEIVLSMLKSLGHDVDVVSDGAAAVEAAARKRYEVVLMDVQMPGMDGVEATRRIRALANQAGRVPIIAMTANALPHQVQSFRDAGMNDYLGKPFTREDLLATMARCVRTDSLSDPAANEPDGTDAEVLDSDIFNALVALLGLDKAHALLGKLLKELEGGFDQGGATDEDYARLGRKAHRLVSSAGMLGFASLAQTCARFEGAIGAGRGVEQGLGAVRDAIRLAIEEISARLGRQADIKKSA